MVAPQNEIVTKNVSHLTFKFAPLGLNEIGARKSYYDLKLYRNKYSRQIKDQVVWKENHTSFIFSNYIFILM